MSHTKSIFLTLALITAGFLGYRAWDANRGDDSMIAPEARRAVKRVAASSDALTPAFFAFSETPSTDDAKSALSELRKTLAAMPKDEAVALIRGFLADGRDHSTGLSFEIAMDGSLTEWPTFRSFLLDSLLSIDSAAAAAISREILASPTTADEWALALRNVARGESLDHTKDFLREKTEELIANPEWQAAPSIGYLNAFDVLVHIEATASTPLLSELVQRKDRKDLAHAGFLTLDRLVQLQPSDVLARLAADRALQESRPEMVSQQFARADVRDPAQRDIVKFWLLDPARTPVELRSFAGVYPNNNRFVSNNLLTRDPGQSGGDLAEHDRDALQTVSAWAEDPEFQPIHETISLIVNRLQGFVSVRSNPSPADPSAPP